MKINNTKDQMPLQIPKQAAKSAPAEESRETQRMQAEEARRAELRQPRQTKSPDGSGLQVNIQA